MTTNGSQNIPTAATGKVLQGAGVGVAPAFSTATYPSTATGTGSILRADGTNFVATTAAYPDTAGTSGNVLTSNGSSWVSSAASSNSFVQFIATGTSSGSLTDSTTYYLPHLNNFDTETSSSSPVVKFTCPITCTITKAYGRFKIASLGSAENCTLFLRLNDTTNTNISTTVQLNSSVVTVNNTGLSISVTAGDILVWGFTGAAWVTNPSQVSFSGSFSI